MSDDRWNDDEDWCDDEDAATDEPSVSCPECGAAMHADAAMCPQCGHWLTEADRRTLESGASHSLWIKIVAIVVLGAFLTAVVASVAF